MRFSVLASGSGANACYVETTESRIMIDAGLSCREIFRRLELIEVNPKTLDAMIITHEHTDHVKGAGPLARLLDIPVYINNPTLKKSVKTLGNISKPVAFHTGQSITINDLRVETFTKCHDAADPMGVVISCDGVKVGLITDLGTKGFTMLAVMYPKMHPPDQSEAILALFDGEISILQSDDPLDCKKSILVKKLRNQDYIKNPICLT